MKKKNCVPKLDQSLIIVDECDRIFLYLSNWSLSGGGGKFLAGWLGKSPVKLSRVIMRAPKGLYVDHINGNVLDNRRNNLRIVTPSGNNLNHASINVCFNVGNKRFQVSLQHKFVGYTITYEDAVVMYKKRHGEVFRKELKKTREFNLHLTDEQYYAHVR